MPSGDAGPRRLPITPAGRDFATFFTAVAGRIAVLGGTLPRADAGQRGSLMRLSKGVARIGVGGVLQMNASPDLIDLHRAALTVSAGAP